jgi:hypothetical protein
MHILPLILFLLMASSLSIAQETIPFRLTKHNNIIVSTLVNEKDSLELMFQISMKHAAISPHRTNPITSIHFENDISENNSVKIGNLKWENIQFFNNEYSAHESDGKIGKVLFENQIFAIDYDNSQFVIYESLPDIKEYTAIPLLVDGDNFLVMADNIFDWQENELWFLMQSGFSGAIMYSNVEAKEYQLAQKLKITHEQVFQDSQGNKVVSKQGILPFLQFGNTVFQDVKIGFFEGDARVQFWNYFGADLMKRFNWIFDVENETAYIKPSKYLNHSFYEFD